MTIREHAKSFGHEVVGNLKRVPTPLEPSRVWRSYEDEGGNTYDVNTRTGQIIICTEDGFVF